MGFKRSALLLTFALATTNGFLPVTQNGMKIKVQQRGKDVYMGMDFKEWKTVIAKGVVSLGLVTLSFADVSNAVDLKGGRSGSPVPTEAYQTIKSQVHFPFGNLIFDIAMDAKWLGNVVHLRNFTKFMHNVFASLQLLIAWSRRNYGLMS